MKRLLCLFLTLVFFPFVSLADDPDPIVGCWYMFIDANDTSAEIIDQGLTYSAILVMFTLDGNILANEVDFLSTSGNTTNPTRIGKWEKDGNTYTSSIISVGINELFLDGDILGASLFRNDQYCLLRRMTPFNVYTEMYRK